MNITLKSRANAGVARLRINTALPPNIKILALARHLAAFRPATSANASGWFFVKSERGLGERIRPNVFRPRHRILPFEFVGLRGNATRAKYGFHRFGDFVIFVNRGDVHNFVR